MVKVNIFVTFKGPSDQSIEVPNKANPCERETWDDVLSSCSIFLESIKNNQLGLRIIKIRMELLE